MTNDDAFSRRLESASASSLPLQAQRHLLLHLDDTRQLRTNPIVAPLFIGVSAGSAAEQRIVNEIRAIVRRAAEAMPRRATGRSASAAKRRFYIVTRCDLGGEAHKTVASELHLSRRQFYRERAIASEIVSAEVHAWVNERPSGSIHVVNPTAIALKQASALRLAGRTAAAASLLEPIACDIADSPNAVRVQCVLADSLADDGQYERAAGVLHTAERAARTMRDVADSWRASALAEIELSRAMMYETEGEVEHARNAAARSMTHAHAAGSSGTDMNVVFARASLMNASFDIRGGEIARARRHLDETAQRIAAIDVPHPDLIVDYSVRRSEVSTLLPDAEDDVIEHYNRAAVLSERHGFPVGAINAVSVYASHLLFGGHIAEAAKQMEAALAISSLRGLPIYGTAELIAGEIACRALRSNDAIRFSRSARAALYEGGCDWGRTFSIEAEAFRIAGDYKRALGLAQTGLEVFARIRADRYAGHVMRLMAECYAALGLEAEARTYIGDAVSVLESRGHARSLQRVYAASAAITGDAKHADAARRLISAHG